jgi:hypothetical protein
MERWQPDIWALDPHNGHEETRTINDEWHEESMS